MINLYSADNPLITCCGCVCSEACLLETTGEPKVCGCPRFICSFLFTIIDILLTPFLVTMHFFKKKYSDKITNFNPSTDTLEIDTDSFGIDSSATFATGKNKKTVKKKLSKQDFDFLYDEKKGGLYFNENGADKGFGDGGIIAILKGAPDLMMDNIDFV